EAVLLFERVEAGGERIAVVLRPERAPAEPDGEGQRDDEQQPWQRLDARQGPLARRRGPQTVGGRAPFDQVRIVHASPERATWPRRSRSMRCAFNVYVAHGRSAQAWTLTIRATCPPIYCTT